MLAECWETKQTAYRPLTEGEDFLQGLWLKVATLTEQENKGHGQAAEALKKLKVAEANAALQLTLLEDAWEGRDTEKAAIAKLQEQLTAISAESSRLSAKQSALTNEFSRVKLQKAAEPATLYNLKSVAGSCERHEKRARMTRQDGESYTALLWRRSLPCCQNKRTTKVVEKR